MTNFTIQVSNHPDALAPGLQTAEVAASWTTVFDGPSFADQARSAAHILLCSGFSNVRIFRGLNGPVWYQRRNVAAILPSEAQS